MNRRQFLKATSAALILPGIVKAESIMRINPPGIISPFNADEGAVLLDFNSTLWRDGDIVHWKKYWNNHTKSYVWIADKDMGTAYIEEWF